METLLRSVEVKVGFVVKVESLGRGQPWELTGEPEGVEGQTSDESGTPSWSESGLVLEVNVVNV